MFKYEAGNEEMCAIPIIHEIVNALAQGAYHKLNLYIDDMGYYSLALLQKVVEIILEDNGVIDAYDVPLKPQKNKNYNRLTFYHLNDGSGMSCEYDLTTHGEPNDWTLQLRFQYQIGKVKVILEDLHVL